MKITRARTLVAWAVLPLALLACGGGDDDATAAKTPPQLRLSITATEDFPGTYGSVGEYERLTGTIAGEVDPKDPKNAVIQDLALAPVNANGMVEYTAEFVMLKPKDMSRASGVLRYDAPNRGNILTMVNPAATPSDAIYLERGYSTRPGRATCPRAAPRGSRSPCRWRATPMARRSPGPTAAS
jgi:hypothetical protein